MPRLVRGFLLELALRNNSTYLPNQELGGVPRSGVRAEGLGFAVGALQGTHGGRDQEVIGELR